uniref:Uncharacterized protein n=1 Tax=viral metagenome TaxID=1070528 RepID=A0A6M3L9G8_9ZZZZ
MTVAEIVDRARFYSRVDSTAASNDFCAAMVADAARQFSHDVFGLPIEEYLLAPAAFDTNTSYAVGVAITGGANALSTTDVAITTTARTLASGTTIGTDFAATLNAAIATGDLTISFTNFYFTIDTTTSTESTAITFSSPDAEDYLDAQGLLGLAGSLTYASGTFAGSFPEDCTRRVTLSGTPISVKHVAWNKYALSQAPRSSFIRPDRTGDPSYYFVEGNQVLITPAPSSQKELYVMYKGVPDLSDISNYASGTIPSIIPAKYHIGLAYWVAAELLMGTFEDEMRAQRLSSYYRIVQEYLVNYNNQNTSLGPEASPGLWYRVEE